MDGETASAILKRANDVLKTNRPVGNNHMTTHGSDWMWAVTALMAVLFLITLGLTLVTKHRQRVYHYLALALLLIPTITYFTMASNLGSTAIRTEFKQDGIQGRTRQVFWVRYIGWFITWPIIVLSLLLMTGVGWSTIIFTMGLSMLYAVMFLCGALTHSSFKWGYFVIALLALFLLAYQLLVAARPWARRFDTSKWYIPLAAYTLFFWCLYPISWGLSEGGNVISNDGEHVFYGILDIFSKGLFALALVFLAKQMDFKRLGLWMHDHGRLAPGYDDGTGRHEKLAHHPVQPGRDSGYDHDQYAGSGGARVTDTTTTTTTGV
ncbi:hypothetical protein DFH27DRAFT_479101 [Peziza echinospora]|nr:hypothetical protein DFH27DRAFT_479101 [Peziza echinospora]